MASDPHAEIDRADAPSAGIEPEPTSPPTPRPWGPWATIGWTALCLAVLVAVQIGVVILCVVVRLVQNPRARIDDLPMNGNVIAAGTLASVPLVVGLVVFLVRIRRCPVQDYLALGWASRRHVFLAVAGLAVLLTANDLTSYLIGHPLVPLVMVDIYRSSWFPLLMLALLVAAPLEEEILLRGFLYKGIAAARPGPIVAVIVSSIVWGLLHIQYDWYGIVSIMIMGLYLGVVRYKTASLWLTMLLHGLANAIATVEVVIQSR
jgi:membrane protease YdiL (CAAX protease family)